MVGLFFNKQYKVVSIQKHFDPSLQVIKLIDFGFDFCLFSVAVHKKAHQTSKYPSSEPLVAFMTVSTSTCYESFFFHQIDPTIMTMTSETRTRRRTQHSLDLEQSSSVSPEVANVEAVLVDITVCRRHLQQTRMKNGGSVPGRRFRLRTRRSV